MSDIYAILKAVINIPSSASSQSSRRVFAAVAKFNSLFVSYALAYVTVRLIDDNKLLKCCKTPFLFNALLCLE